MATTILTQTFRQEFVVGDCLEWLKDQPDDSVDMIFTSPPYESRRKYDELGFNLRGEEWVRWALERYIECDRVCKGLVVWVVEGMTQKFEWSATPALLMADLKRVGIKLRKPPIYKRSGIPGSGGPDWLRNCYEFCIASSKGRLPWSDNKVCGHKPKYPPGGKLSYRDENGTRRHLIRGTSGYKDGDAVDHRASEGNLLDRAVTEIANPGNVFETCSGGGHLGHDLAHENEAPYPESLVTPFIRSFCPPGGVVVDIFGGSGTVAAVARKWNRGFVNIDIRESQYHLAQKRVSDSRYNPVETSREDS